MIRPRNGRRTASTTKIVPTPWPEEFTIPFEEVLYYPSAGKNLTIGKMWYSAKQNKFRIDRNNGREERFCGTTIGFEKEPCSQIFNNGVRYLWFPKSEFCCTCCTAEQGCGVLKQDWNKNGIFEGVKTNLIGQKYKDFFIEGEIITRNRYSELDQSGIPLNLRRIPYSEIHFNDKFISTKSIDPSIFDVPTEQNCEVLCPEESQCTKVRN